MIGRLIPHMKEALEITMKSHFKLMPNVPIVGNENLIYSIVKTDEVFISCFASIKLYLEIMISIHLDICDR